MDSYAPTREDRFSFGLWTVGNPGRDPFGGPVRSTLEPTYIVLQVPLGTVMSRLHYARQTLVHTLNPTE